MIDVFYCDRKSITVLHKSNQIIINHELKLSQYPGIDAVIMDHCEDKKEWSFLWYQLVVK